MPRPRSFSQGAIAAAALAVVDREGLDGLSMRNVAGELGVTAMALYRYVEDREQLETWTVEHVLGSLDLTLPPDQPWTDRIALLMDRLRVTVAAHPAAVPLLVTHRHTAPTSLRWIETMLSVLSEAGFAGKERVVAQRSLVSYLLGALQAEHLGPLSGTGTRAMAELPAAEFPRLAETARDAGNVTADEEFHFGLTALLSGLSPPA